MGTRILQCLSVAMVLAVSVSQAPAATVTINPSNEYQTIDGFGGFGLDLISTNAYLDKLINDLGVSMFRINTGEAGQTTTEWVNWVNAAKARAAVSGETLRFIASCWSPPASMKVNNSESGLDPATNKLKADQYDEYAVVLRTFLNTMKSQTNTDLYGISFQNERAFPESYWSCVYTPTEYRDMVKVVGPVIHAAHPNIKVFGAEHMLSNWGTFEGTLIQDAASKAQMGALAVHGYSDGVHPQPTSTAATLWSRASRNAVSAGLPLWMTETSGYNQDWAGAMQLAEMIYAALKFGKLSAWVYWTISGGSADAYHLMVGQNATDLYYVSKNYYRYVRPGAVMVDALSDDSLVFSLAFRHKTSNTLSVVLINGATTAKTVNISGASLPTFNRYLTSSSVKCVDQGTTSGASVSLPASSVTTLYGTNYNPTVSVQQPRQAVRTAPRAGAFVSNSESYSLRGERMASSVGRTAAGVTLRKTVFSDGATAISPIAVSH